MNDERQERLAERLAETVVRQVLLEAEEDKEAALGEIRSLVDYLETHPPWLKLFDLQDHKSLSRQLVGLPSFLRVVQDYPEAAQEWDDLPESDEKKSVLAVSLWSRGRL